MPDFVPYGGTITFKPDYCLEYKNEFIQGFVKFFKKYLLFGERSSYFIKVVKEYHKVDGQDDYEAPHLHFILYSAKPLTPFRTRVILKAFKDVAGLSQFYRMTTLKEQSYSKYIQKDIGKPGVDYYECFIEPYEVQVGQFMTTQCVCCREEFNYIDDDF